MGVSSQADTSIVHPSLPCPPLVGLDTGDLVLFDRPCLKMGGFFGAAICSVAKVVGGSPYDHIGVVVSRMSKHTYDESTRVQNFHSGKKSAYLQAPLD